MRILGLALMIHTSKFAQRSGHQPAVECLPSESQVSSEKDDGIESLYHQEPVVAKIQSGITGQSKGVEKCDFWRVKANRSVEVELGDRPGAGCSR